MYIYLILYSVHVYHNTIILLSLCKIILYFVHTSLRWVKCDAVVLSTVIGFGLFETDGNWRE